MGKAWRPNHLRWLGLNDELQEAVATARQVTEEHSYLISSVARLTTRKWTEEQFLKSAGEDRGQRYHHLMVIAFERLTDPNRRDKAIEALEEAIDLDMRAADFHYWCLATLKTLRENPAWPASLREEKQPSH